MKDIHTEHCCILHGCKYGQDDTCTVMTKLARQSYRCEVCEHVGIDIRPWGHYQVLVDESTHKVKTITINAGKRISLQRHQKREEIWTCVTGWVLVTLYEKGNADNTAAVLILRPGESVRVPCGWVHRAAAPDTIDTTFIEVQLGTYFGEDDIERFEDDFGRTG